MVIANGLQFSDFYLVNTNKINKKMTIKTKVITFFNC